VPDGIHQAAESLALTADSNFQPYSLEPLTLGAASDSWISSRHSLAHACPSDPMRDPEWLRGFFAGETNNLWIYALSQGGRHCGLAPFLRRHWSFKWQIGELTLADWPLTRFRLLGGEIDFPCDEAAYDLLFGELANGSQGCDALHLEEIPVDSFLWRYLNESRFIRKSFLRYEPEPPAGRPMLRFQGTFEQYMGKFSSKHRKNLNREVRKVREGGLGEMSFVRYEALGEVDVFLDQAVELSRKTYQWALHQRGLSATELLRSRLRFAAERGWMRCYLLSCGGTPAAFLLGFQHRGRFLFHEIGFDPELAKHSVGTVMQLLAIEDLFNYNTPEILDFGEYGRYKEAFSTESFLQGKILLFKKTAYARFLRGGHRGCTVVNRSLSSALDRLNLKTKLRQRLRGWRGSK